MDILIWVGAAMSLAGLIGLIWCIAKIWTAKRAGLDEARLRDAIRKVLPLNTGALFLSVLGLMVVVIGIALG